MFEEIELFKELTSRKDRKSVYYAAYIVQIEKNFGPVLENIKALFSEYPDHGINHSIRIMEYIGSIMSGRFKRNLSSLEIVILFFAAIFHDSGMCLFNSSETEISELRKQHHLASEKVINSYFDNAIGDMIEKERIKRAVVFVCQAHGYTIEELTSDPRFSIEDTIDTFTVRYGLLAFLLRIGDLMDLESERVNNFRMMLYSASFKTESLNHNERHQKVEQFNHTPKAITIRVSAGNDRQYEIWTDWLRFLKTDIEMFNALFAHAGLFFPIPDITISKSPSA